MSENINARNSEQKPMIELNPPELVQVPKEFIEILGKEIVMNQLIESFSADYFQIIENNIKQRFPNKKIGLRAVLGSKTEDNLPVERLNRPSSVTAIKQILATGSDLRGLNTRVTRPNIISEESNHKETDMSKTYLRKMIEEAFRFKKEEISPLILVYDLEMTKKVSIYEIEFPDQETMKNSLLEVYAVNIQPLIDLEKTL